MSKNLMEVLMDDSILPYFMEYMQKQNAMNLLNFWLTAETFRLSTINRLRINSMSRLKQPREANSNVLRDENLKFISTSENLQSSSSSTNPERNTDLNSSADELQSVSSDSDEFGTFTSYMPKSKTTANDGENVVLLCEKCGSIIVPSSSNADVCEQCRLRTEETGNRTLLDNSYTSSKSNAVGNVPSGLTQADFSGCQNSISCTLSNVNLAGCNSGTQRGGQSSKVTFDLIPDYEHQQREFCQRRTRSIVIDAVSIYSKYISLEASHPVGLEESIRQEVESK